MKVRKANLGTTWKGARRSAGFTIIELLGSIFVIGILISLLVVGLQYFMAAGQKTKQRAAVTAMKQAVVDFQGKFGFVPPLVQDQYDIPPIIPGSLAAPANGMIRVAVVSDRDLMKVVVDDPLNPYKDKRYSVRTLPYYLVGACDAKLFAAGGSSFPIDGVEGAGYYAPNRDGTFRIPEETLRAVQLGNPPRKLTAEVHEPFIDVGSGDPKIARGADPQYDPAADVDDAAKVQMRDFKNVAYRYYRWTKQNPLVAGVVNQNIPRIVGDANDAAVRGASYAIVGAGPNQVFGDEDVLLLRTRLGKPLSFPEVQARTLAASDNVVEVGQ